MYYDGFATYEELKLTEPDCTLEKCFTAQHEDLHPNLGFDRFRVRKQSLVQIRRLSIAFLIVFECVSPNKRP